MIVVEKIVIIKLSKSWSHLRKSLRSRPFFIFGLDNHGTSLKLANDLGFDSKQWMEKDKLANDLEIDFRIWGKESEILVKNQTLKPNLGLE